MPKEPMATQTATYSVFLGTDNPSPEDVAFVMFLLDQDDAECDRLFAPVEPAEMAPSGSVAFEF